MKSERVDGMNVMEVRNITLRLLDEIRQGSGPQLLEAITYRFRGHSMGDPERYRNPEEIHKWQEEDPIGIYRRFLIENNIAGETELNEQDSLSLKEIQEAIQFAEASPLPSPEDTLLDVYV